MDDPLWNPSQVRVQHSLITQFMTDVNERWVQSLESYDNLWTWSVTPPKAFWENVWDFCDVIGERSSDRVIESTRHLERKRPAVRRVSAFWLRE